MIHKVIDLLFIWQVATNQNLVGKGLYFLKAASKVNLFVFVFFLTCSEMELSTKCGKLFFFFKKMLVYY